MRGGFGLWWTVARHEYVVNVRRREFVLLTIGMPLMMLGVFGVSLLSGRAAAGLGGGRGPARVQIYDPGHALFGSDGVNTVTPGMSLRTQGRLEAGMDDIRAGRADTLIALDADYLRTGGVRVYNRDSAIFGKGERVPTTAILSQSLLGRAVPDPLMARRILQPAGEAGPTFFTLDRGGKFLVKNVAREAARFIVPYIFTLLLTMSIFFSATYLLRGISDEKENRVIEVILSSIRAEDLLLGKLVGLAGVGLTQIGIWLCVGAAPLLIRYHDVVRLQPGALPWLVLFFALGYALYATIMAGLAALGTSYRESQQVASMVSAGAFMPMLALPVLLEAPNGTLAQALSWIPFTAPATMVLRLTATEVPLAQIAISAASLALGVWALRRASEKLFRYGLLIFGRRPGLMEAIRCLRSA